MLPLLSHSPPKSAACSHHRQFDQSDRESGTSDRYPIEARAASDKRRGSASSTRPLKATAGLAGPVTVKIKLHDRCRVHPTLPPNDPLFAAEFQQPLMQNFENPVLMRLLR